MLEEVRRYVGRPYDVRYRMDDEKIYCSELIYKSYLTATGEPLGRLDRFGDLNWEPFRETVERFEGGPPPVERLMITPRGLTEAPEVTLAYSFGL